MRHHQRPKHLRPSEERSRLQHLPSMGSGHPGSTRDVAQREGSHSAGRLNLPRNRWSPRLLHDRPRHTQPTPGRDAHPGKGSSPPPPTYRRIRRHGHPDETALATQGNPHHRGVHPACRAQQRRDSTRNDKQGHGMAANSRERRDRRHPAGRPERLRQPGDRPPPTTTHGRRPSHAADAVPHPIRILLRPVARETRRSGRIHLANG